MLYFNIQLIRNFFFINIYVKYNIKTNHIIKRHIMSIVENYFDLGIFYYDISILVF